MPLLVLLRLTVLPCVLACFAGRGSAADRDLQQRAAHQRQQHFLCLLRTCVAFLKPCVACLHRRFLLVCGSGPSITGVAGVPLPTQGGTVTVTGTNFGARPQWAQVKLGSCCSVAVFLFLNSMLTVLLLPCRQQGHLVWHPRADVDAHLVPNHHTACERITRPGLLCG